MTLNTYPTPLVQAGGPVTDPTAPWISWSVEKTPNWATRMQRAVSGRELRSSDYVLPIYTFTLRYEVIRDRWDKRMGAGIGPAYNQGPTPLDELRAIWKFYNQQFGPDIPFQFWDETDYTTRAIAATPQVTNFAVGDGVTTSFQMASPLLAPVIPISVASVTPAIANSIDANTGMITFTSAPGVGVAIGADMVYNYKVRFADDNLGAENFAFQFWQMRTVKLVSVPF